MDTAEAVALAVIVGGGLYVLHSRTTAVPVGAAVGAGSPNQANIGAALSAAGLGPWGQSAAFLLTHPKDDANAVKGLVGAPSAFLGNLTGSSKVGIVAGLQSKGFLK